MDRCAAPNADAVLIAGSRRGPGARRATKADTSRVRGSAGRIEDSARGCLDWTRTQQSTQPWTEMSRPLFHVRDLAKVYRMGEVEVHALRQVTLALDEGQFVVLLGPSGSGKSTLLNIIGGLDVPTSGRVLYRDVDLTQADEGALTAYRREHVGFVFQFYNLIPSLTAVENVALVTEISTDPMAPEDALGLVKLDQRRDHFPAQLSGGEQQRVAIARAIAKRPSVLLCDEPTGALDISTGIVVLEALQRVNAELGTTTVVITHNAAIASMADRVVRLADGRVVAVEDRTEKLSAQELVW
jgi:putative ABC transport system ATP-binding protein